MTQTVAYLSFENENEACEFRNLVRAAESAACSGEVSQAEFAELGKFVSLHLLGITEYGPIRDPETGNVHFLYNANKHSNDPNYNAFWCSCHTNFGPSTLLAVQHLIDVRNKIQAAQEKSK